MASFTETHLDVDGVETAVLTAGDGPPLVFFHGGGIVEGADCFVPLAERFRVVVGYHPGFGGTAVDPRIDGIEGWVRHYDGLLEQLGIGEFVLIGHSLGGWLASRFVLEHRSSSRRGAARGSPSARS
jgi:pimeloyl-ACP methyl ester carboxylesterase